MEDSKVDDVEMSMRERRSAYTPYLPKPSSLSNAEIDDDPPTQSEDTERKAWEFRGRHIQMMALGILFLQSLLMVGVSIGTGVLYQSGYDLFVGGPVTLLLAYISMGTVAYAVIVQS